MKEINSVVYSEKEPSKECLWLHYVNDKLTLEAFGNTGWVPVQEKELKEINNKVGNLEDLTTEAKNSLVEAINEVAEGGSSGGGMVEITYSELKSLRDDNKLVPGTQYRITDYHCTTSQEKTTSADHQFDIIVTADSESVLNENARAIQHDFSLQPPQLFMSGGPEPIRAYRAPEQDIDYDDTHYYAYSIIFEDQQDIVFCKNNPPVEHDAVYMWESEQMEQLDSEVVYFYYSEAIDYFADSNLAAWELKYCLDNDTDRFAWAKPQEDMVIVVSDAYYRRCPSQDLDDEYFFVSCEGNEPYDIIEDGEVIYAKSPTPEVGDLIRYLATSEEGLIVAIEREDSKGGNGVIYYMKDEWNNECPYDFKNIQFYRWWNEDKQMWCNTYGDEDNFVAAYTFSKEKNSGITSFTDCSLSKDNWVHSNIIKENFDEQVYLSNICFFGADCYANTFEGHCYENSFAPRCFGNSFGYNCNSNSFGYNCNGNSFGYNCITISFGSNCSENSFGNGCNTISFGDNCKYNSFGKNCENIWFSNSTFKTPGDWFWNNTVESSANYIILYNTAAAGVNQKVNKYYIKSSIYGRYSSPMTIQATRGLSHDTTIALNSAGTPVTYCEADLVS